MRYVKPTVNVIDLQIKENIAATNVNSTVYTGPAANGYDIKSMALSQSTTGITTDADGLVSES